MKRAIKHISLTLLICVLALLGGKVYAYSSGYAENLYLTVPMLETLGMSWENANFTGTYGYTIVNTYQFSSQQSQLIYTGTDSDPVASNIGEYISDIEVRNHVCKINSAWVYTPETSTAFSGISAVASQGLSTSVTISNNQGRVGCEFELFGVGYYSFPNGVVEDTVAETFS